MKAKGRILKVKMGYNPNSSSIGTHVMWFVRGAAAVAAVSAILMGYIAAIRKPRSKKKAGSDGVTG